MNPRAKLTVKQAAKYLHVSVSTLKRWRANKTGPTWFKATDAINSSCLYEVADLDRWVMLQKDKA